MFERVVFCLLEGAFICRVLHPEMADFLSDEENLRAVDAFLGRLGRRVARTSRQTGFYLAFANYGDNERAKIRANYTDIKNSLGPVVSFFKMVIRITGHEELLMQGAIIEVDTLMGKIDRDASLRSELQSVGIRFKTSSDTSQRKQLESIIKRMVSDEYLVLVNPERMIYMVTAKIEYLLDVIAFIYAHDDAVKSDESDADALANATRTLL